MIQTKNTTEITVDSEFRDLFPTTSTQKRDSDTHTPITVHAPIGTKETVPGNQVVLESTNMAINEHVLTSEERQPETLEPKTDKERRIEVVTRFHAKEPDENGKRRKLKSLSEKHKVPERSVSRANFVYKNASSELWEKINAGKVSLYKAEAELRKLLKTQ